MSRLRCFPYRFVFYTILHLQELIEVSCPKKTSSGPVNDPYFVAQSYIKFAKKKKISKTEQVFKEALIQAESAYLTKIGKKLSQGHYIRKWKQIERNKGLGSENTYRRQIMA